MRGRIPGGPECVEQLEGSDKAKERLRVVLETMMGKWRVAEACQRLGISEQRFRQLRQELLQAALASLEDRPAGRPRQPQEPADSAALRQQVAELQRELEVAQVREEIALALPQLSKTMAQADAGAAAAPKKTPAPALTVTVEPLPPLALEESTMPSSAAASVLDLSSVPAAPTAAVETLPAPAPGAVVSNAGRAPAPSAVPSNAAPALQAPAPRAAAAALAPPVTAASTMPGYAAASVPVGSAALSVAAPAAPAAPALTAAAGALPPTAAAEQPPLTPPAAQASASAAHRARLHELLRLGSASADTPPRRHGRQPSDRQRLQHDIRQEAVDCYHRLPDQGLTLGECGQLLQLAPRTLRAWDHECRLETLGLLPVGRPLRRSPVPVRQAILDYLQATGPGVGVPTLREQFADVARGELADLLARYRDVYRACHRQCPRVLHWQTPGRVWAADFTEPSRYGLAGKLPPIAGCYPYVLAVRDLASGLMLAWQALPDVTAEVTRAALADLFAVHGAPLVLKVDNGSAFRAGALQEHLEASGVIPLYSPPSCPGYNGAIEAAIGSLKKRTHEQAQGRGHADRWDLADLAAAQAVANSSHPRRLNGRTPAALWESRAAIAPLERVVFTLTVERQRYQARVDLGIGPEETLDHWRAGAVDRQAIERALVEHGHLLFTRKRIPLTIRTKKVTADV